MISKFAGHCTAQGDRTHPGDNVVRHGGGWAHQSCIEANARHNEIIRRVQSAGLGLGVWGLPEGVDHTFTRREFVDKALKRGLITADEAEALRRAWTSVYDFALDD
jgi:NADH:ubiquinone oxidoreductase subunit F (NADH-binding)